jgi:hypothetical protein
LPNDFGEPVFAEVQRSGVEQRKAAADLFRENGSRYSATSCAKVIAHCLGNELDQLVRTYWGA